MQTQPYEKYSIRSKRFWDEAANLAGCSTSILRNVYHQKYWGLTGTEFVNSLKRKPERLEKLKQECQAVALTAQEIEDEQTLHKAPAEENDFDDLLQYRLKQLIQVGDEWLAQESKTFLSGPEYITKGKRYRITELDDRRQSLSEFSARTTTNFPEETNCIGNYGCNSLWRDGVEIWNWHLAYLELAKEQIPDDPQIPELTAHCHDEAEKIRAIQN